MRDHDLRIPSRFEWTPHFNKRCRWDPDKHTVDDTVRVSIYNPGAFREFADEPLFARGTPLNRLPLGAVVAHERKTVVCSHRRRFKALYRRRQANYEARRLLRNHARDWGRGRDVTREMIRKVFTDDTFFRMIGQDFDHEFTALEKKRILAYAYKVFRARS